MLLQADAKALEWVCASYLSQDPIAMEEVLNNVDQHSDNQERFGLPSRLVAKTFVFRLIYGDRPGVMQEIPILKKLVEKSSGKELLISSIQNMYDSENGMLTLSMTLKEIEN